MTVGQLIEQLREMPDYYEVEVEVRTVRSGTFTADVREVEQRTRGVVIR